MPLSEELRLRRAEAADLPRIAELREAVGWSVHEWALRMVVATREARCLVAVNGSVPFWERHGFVVTEEHDLYAKLLSYEEGARYMVRKLA